MSNLPLIAVAGYALILCLSAFSCANMERAPATTHLAAAPLSAPSVEEQRAQRVAAMAASWPKTPDYRISFAPLSPARAQTADAGSYASFDPDDEYWGLPRSAGHEDVALYCSACHTLEIVMQQRATEARWLYMLDWMVEEQNMPPLSDSDKAVVLGYLSENFGLSQL